MSEFLKININDQVAVALKDHKKGDSVIIQGQSMVLVNDIPMGHKVALCSILKGNDIKKYGFSIGHATADIKKGEHIHSHNLSTSLNSNLEYNYTPQVRSVKITNEDRTFKAYLRKNGDVGVRNELWIVPTVGCVNGQAKQIVARLKSECDTSHLDAIEVLSHQYGCSQLGDDHENTKRALAAAIIHPNAGAVLVLGLGCENNQVDSLKEYLGQYDAKRIRFLVAQEVEDEIAEGFKITKELLEITKQDKREAVPLSKLKIGLKCGGSDAFSGITANPLLGRFSDWLIAQGGSTVLTEVPEMFGAEKTLMNRAKNEEVFKKIVTLINGFKDYFRKNKQVIYENPSPGNKDGGITSLEEKSLGNVQKGGESMVVEVLNYADRIKENGLNLLWSPGNDLVSSSALAMAGCQIVLFTTGRGTPFGSFVPTMKISSNSQLYKNKNNWIDFNAGEILESTPIDELSQKLIDFIIAVAEGQLLKHELAEFKEIAIFKSGVTL